MVKVIATTISIFFLLNAWGRKPLLFISAMGMGTLFFIVGALLKVYPPASTPQPNPPASGKAMAAMLYIYVCFYSMGWGPLPWVYTSDIFPTRTRHYGMAVASSSQWLWSKCFSNASAGEHLQAYDPICRLCCGKGDAYHSHKARLQDVLDVCLSERGGDGSVFTV